MVKLASHFLHDEFVWLAHGRSNTSNGAPRIHNGLSSSNGRVGFQGTILEASHHQGNNDVTFLLGHLGGNGQQHEHVVALGDAHGIEIAQDVSAGDFT